MKQVLASTGIEVPEIFVDANVLEALSSRSETKEFEKKLFDVKNQIYQNIYNNLNYIFKSKGTEKAFRNLIRCYGIDDELVKLNLYGDNVTFKLRDNFTSTAAKKAYVDFNHVDKHNSAVFQYGNSDAPLSYIPGFGSPQNIVSGGLGMTFETEVYFPRKFRESSELVQSYPYYSASLFGIHTAVAASDPETDLVWKSPDVSEFQVYAVKDVLESNQNYVGDAYFQLTSSYLGINLTSSLYSSVYDNDKWNFAVRIKPTKYPFQNSLTGATSASLGTAPAETSLTYDVSFYGVNTDLDVVVDEFSLSTTISASLGDTFLSGSKRLYLDHTEQTLPALS